MDQDTLAALNNLISDLTATYGGVRDIGIGTSGQRPAAGTANRFFYATDERKLYYDDGAEWDLAEGDYYFDGPVLYVNESEAGAGVTGGFAGIEISRGTLDAVKLGYQEGDDTWIVGSAVLDVTYTLDNLIPPSAGEILTDTVTGATAVIIQDSGGSMTVRRVEGTFGANPATTSGGSELTINGIGIEVPNLVMINSASFTYDNGVPFFNATSKLFEQTPNLTYDGTKLDTNGLSLAGGQVVDTIETALTDDDTHMPTSGAVYDYVNLLVDVTLKAPEAYDPAGSGNFPTTYDGAAVQRGDSFRITSADTLGVGTIVNAEDLLIALVDTPGQTDANWMVAESNRDQATETTKGVAEIATQAEVNAETDDERIVTALKLGVYAAALLHNDRTDLQGGQASEYYHLTALEHSTYALDIVTGAHSFSTGDPVYNNGTSWVAAQANDRDTLTQGVVYVIDVTNYVVISHGKLTYPAPHGFPVGEYLFLGETGGLTDLEPQGMTLLSDPVAYVLDASTIIVLPFRPSDSIPRSNDLYGKTITFADTPYNVQDIDELLLVDTTGGPVDVILPVGADYDNFLAGIKKIAGANSVFAKTTTGLVEGVAGTTGREISVLYAGEKFWHNGTDYWIAP
jgi:hypothetical protein